MTFDAPPPLLWAAACLALLVVEHVVALATPPYGLHGPFLFHLAFGALYAWLGLEVLAGEGWAAIVLTVLVATQTVGRVFVWRAEDRSYAAYVKAALAAGAAVSLLALGLLWVPDASRSWLIG